MNKYTTSGGRRRKESNILKCRKTRACLSIEVSIGKVTIHLREKLMVQRYLPHLLIFLQNLKYGTGANQTEVHSREQGPRGSPTVLTLTL